MQMQRMQAQDEEYIAETILKARYSPQGTPQFLIKWVGYPMEESTWEPVANIPPELVDRYRQQQQQQQAMQQQQAQMQMQRNASPRRAASPRPGMMMPRGGRSSSPRPGGILKNGAPSPRGRMAAGSPRMAEGGGHRNSTAVLAPPGGHSSICFG